MNSIMILFYNVLVSVQLAEAQLNAAILGNWGAGNWSQKSVAGNLNSVCGDKACSLVISPGSNFMGGIRDLQDNVFSSAFSGVYTGKNLHLPFYSTLGSEDWRFNVTAEAYYSQLTYGLMDDNDERIRGEVDEETGNQAVSQKVISAGSAKFTLPNWYYHTDIHFSEESSNPLFSTSDKNAIFVFIDTYMLSDSFPDQSLTAEHWNWLENTLSSANSAGHWVIVVGDSSIYSSGKIGGSREMQKNLLPLLKKHETDVYISGDDYDMELMQDGSLILLNCGNGAYGSGQGLRSAPTSIKFIGQPGFCTIKLKGEIMTTEMFDGRSGASLFTGDLKKASRSVNIFTRSKGLAGLPSNSFTPLPWGIGGSIGPNGEGGAMTPSIMLFIKIVGSIGLTIQGIVCTIGLLTVAARIQKWQKA
eukprot:GHVH01010616.1.p1 GENE.GHVH01010616.1~~GHVH01010616.1.p1  ORF type:complete len:417 (+),score=63.92 GHVH01010616.1:116-1366(+)